MKTKHALFLLAMGFVIDFIGVFVKILHTQYADALMFLGMLLKVIGLLLFVYKLFTNPKAKEFLNW